MYSGTIIGFVFFPWEETQLLNMPGLSQQSILFDYESPALSMQT